MESVDELTAMLVTGRTAPDPRWDQPADIMVIQREERIDPPRQPCGCPFVYRLLLPHPRIVEITDETVIRIERQQIESERFGHEPHMLLEWTGRGATLRLQMEGGPYIFVLAGSDPARHVHRLVAVE